MSLTAPPELGVHPREGGVDVAVVAVHATRVEFCLVEEDKGIPGGWRERRVPLRHRTHGVWHDHVPEVPVGSHYGFRVDGPWEPWHGHRHNHTKFLLDPYARAVTGPVRLRPELYAHVVGPDLRGDAWHRDERDSLRYAPKGLVTASDGETEGTFDWAGDTRPDVPWNETVVYEAHVKGFTQRLPGVPDELRGTYLGMAHDVAVGYLKDLGVTSLELLPVQASQAEAHLQKGGLTNYWGYNTLGFFAPHPLYARGGERTASAEFKTMVRALHAAGIEVLLDVVYNHTCEAGVSGPSLSFRGLDAATYYRLDSGGRDIDTTGCGNSLDARDPWVARLTLDSLRYWVEVMHVDGFRFDLAPTLARGNDGYDPEHAILVAMRTDPVLRNVKLVAEPWDLGPYGWRTGHFPPPFAEWNDRYRDGLREFWLADARRLAHGEAPGSGVRDLAMRLAGSADLFSDLRGPLSSINFVTAHDGFTLADLVSYDHKHNEANLEDNRDGTDENRGWNFGTEGNEEGTAPEVLAGRRRAMRAVLGTLLLSTGVPMLTAGDEFGRSQGGNNNAYCQDSPIGWVDWDHEPWQADLLETTKFLVALRQEYGVLRQPWFFAGRPVHPDGTKDLAWFTAAGEELTHDAWHDPANRVLQMYLHAHDGRSLLLVFQGGGEAKDVLLPGPPWAGGYRLLWDSARSRPPAPGEVHALPPRAVVKVPAGTVRVYAAPPPPGAPRPPVEEAE